MKIEKKYVVAGAIMLVSITAGLLYLQYQKFQEWCIGVTKIGLNSFTWTAADIDLFIFFRNKSSLKITLFSQEYVVFLNDKQVAKVSNAVPQTLAPNSDSPLAVKLQFSPKDALAIVQMNIGDLIAHQDKINIKISMKFTVGLYFIKTTIPFDYISTLKEMTTSSDPNSTGLTCK